MKRVSRSCGTATKKSNTRASRVLEKEKEDRVEKVFEEIMAEIFPILAKKKKMSNKSIDSRN